MKTGGAALLEQWLQGGPFIGDDGAANAYVTVEPDWYLNVAIATSSYRYPVRWWKRADNSQTEIEVPNIKGINIDRGIDDIAAAATITLYNQKMDPNLAGSIGELGSPGWFTWQRGASADSRARWGHEENEWADVLVPEALLRTYQGWGGRNKSLDQALADGNVVLTGTWLIDSVSVGTDGMMTISCRDMGKLLVEQQSYPPLVPREFYPVDFRRWRHETQTITTNPNAGNKAMTYVKSGNQAWYGPDGEIGGHVPEHALDSNPESYWMSVGNGHPNLPWAVEWLEVDVGGAEIDHVFVWPKMGNYTCFVSVMEDGVWQGTDTIPYDPQNVGRYHSGYDPNYEERIPYVTQGGIPWEQATNLRLPRTFRAQRVRFSFSNLQNSGYGNRPYRALIRELAVSIGGSSANLGTVSTNVDVVSDGNFKDYAEIVANYLLWSGWWHYPDIYTDINSPAVFATLEYTGVPGDDQSQDWVMPKEMFDKKPVADVINELKEIVGHICFTSEDGKVVWIAPNWWSPGNWMEHEKGSPTSLMFTVDEQHLLTDYTATFDGSTLRSEIIIATTDPEADVEYSDTVTTRYVPPTAGMLRGQCRPAMWVNQAFTSSREQEIMAQLIAMHIWFKQRQGQATIIANPLLQPDDQVRIFERQTAETYIHYVRRISSQMDLDSGTYTMTLTTNWLGDGDDWMFQKLGV